MLFAQLQHGHKRGHQLAAAAAALKQKQKPCNTRQLYTPHDLCGFLLHGVRLPLHDVLKHRQLRVHGHLPPIQQLLHGNGQLARLMVVLKHLSPLHRLRILGEDVAAELAHGSQPFRKLADLLVALAPLPLLQRLDKGIHLALRLLVLNGQKHSCLDIHKMRGHGHKLAGHLQIHLLPLFQIFQILIQDQCNGYILNFYFILA